MIRHNAVLGKQGLEMISMVGSDVVMVGLLVHALFLVPENGDRVQLVDDYCHFQQLYERMWWRTAM